MTTDSYQSQTNEYIFNTYARYPITLVKGEGAYAWDAEGKKYLDFLSGIACTPLGHNCKAVTDAIIKQAHTLIHTSNLYHSLPSIELAKYLIAHGGLNKIFFCNSGAEANEAAIKLARKYQWRLGATHKNVILSADHSFHGRTLGALTATAKPKLHEGFAPLPNGFKYQAWDDSQTFCAAIDENVAAVILEPIQGEGGIHVACPDFLRAVRERCDAVGALLIFDEVQCGIGRTGHLFAYQYFGVTPDIITLAKGIANGLPLGAVCASKAVAAGFQPGDHGTTFGGNLISCSAGLVTLKTIVEENYLNNNQKLSVYFLKRLRDLHQHYPEKINEIRGVGLMLGLDLKINAQEVLSKCQQAGLLVNVTADTVLRFLPPYIISEADIDTALTIVEQALQ